MKARTTLLALALSTTAYAQPPKITMSRARSLALQQVPGGRVQSAELETENGRRVYSFDIKTSNAGIEEVQIDANTGAVVSKVHEDAAAEAAEKKADAKKGR